MRTNSSPSAGRFGGLLPLALLLTISPLLAGGAPHVVAAAPQQRDLKVSVRVVERCRVRTPSLLFGTSLNGGAVTIRCAQGAGAGAVVSVTSPRHAGEAAWITVHF